MLRSTLLWGILLTRAIHRPICIPGKLQRDAGACWGAICRAVVLKASLSRVSQAATIVGHLTPDLDCLSAIWILVRFGGYTEALLRFVPSGSTLNGQPVDADPLVIHVDTGSGRFDHHQPGRTALCAAELVRRAIAPRDHVLADMAEQINRLDHATARAPRDDAGRLRSGRRGERSSRRRS